MDMDITLKLPEELVKQAQAAGILTDEQIANLIQTELERRQRRATFFSDVARLRKLEPALTAEEIEAELAAYRRERKDRTQS